jgi:hypothetical protein
MPHPRVTHAQRWGGLAGVRLAQLSLGFTHKLLGRCPKRARVLKAPIGRPFKPGRLTQGPRAIIARVNPKRYARRRLVFERYAWHVHPDKHLLALTTCRRPLSFSRVSQIKCDAWLSVPSAPTLPGTEIRSVSQRSRG